MTIETELRHALAYRKIKGAHVAKVAGLARQQLRDCFHGQRRLKADELLRICGAFDIDPMQFEVTKKSSNPSRQRSNQGEYAPCPVKYEQEGAILQMHQLKNFDPFDPQISYVVHTTLAPNRIETLSIEIRKGEASQEIRLI